MVSVKINKLDKNCIIIIAGSQIISVNILFCTGAYLIRHCATETTWERTRLWWHTSGFAYTVLLTSLVKNPMNNNDFASSYSCVPFLFLFPFSLNSSYPSECNHKWAKIQNFPGRVAVFPNSLPLATIGFLATFHDSTQDPFSLPSTECLQMPLPSRVHNGWGVH